MALSLACGRLESVVLSFCIITRRDERGMGSQFGRVLACCKVGLDRPLIPTAVVANSFRSARVFRWGDAGRGLGDRRSQRTGVGSETTARTSMYKTHFSPVLDGRVVKKSRNRSVPPSGINYAGKGLMIVKHVAIPGHLCILVIHEGASCEPCGLLS